MISEDSDRALSSFPVVLGTVGGGNEFRTQNASPQDWERRNVIERTQDAIHIYCDLMDVKHGTLGPGGGGDLATLMLFRFRFDPQKTSRRILEATVKVDFIAANPYENKLEVSAIAPEERWSLAATTDHEQVVKGGDLSLSSGASVVTAAGSIKREKTTTRDVSHATMVTGSINLGRGRNSGRRTVARWRLLENGKRRTGVPDSVRAAVVLSRTTDDPFNAVVTIEAKADLVTAFSSSVSSLFKQLPLDDPVLFNPKAELERLSKEGRSIGVENLGELDLYGPCDARITGRRYLYSDEAESEST
ncbi:hypothetical protein LQW54_005378 [Pestalotiopsis sp. IQ-011]